MVFPHLCLCVSKYVSLPWEKHQYDVLCVWFKIEDAFQETFKKRERDDEALNLGIYHRPSCNLLGWTSTIWNSQYILSQKPDLTGIIQNCWEAPGMDPVVATLCNGQAIFWMEVPSWDVPVCLPEVNNAKRLNICRYWSNKTPRCKACCHWPAFSYALNKAL